VSRTLPLVRIPVGAVIERRKAKSPWADFTWRPVAVLPGVPKAALWTVLDGDAERTNFYGGAAEIGLYRSDVSGYRDNLATGAAQLWVVFRATGIEPPYEFVAVTAEPSEGESFTENAADLVEAVPMPDLVRAAIADFVTGQHVEQPFIKRQRDRPDPEAMARRRTLKDCK